MKRITRGFTLVEMIVAIGILALVLGLGVPSFIEFSRNNRLTGAANDLLADIHLARTEAIKRHVAMTVCASADPLATSPSCAAANATTFTGWIVFVDDANPAASAAADGNAVIDAGEQILRRHALLHSGISAKSDAGFLTYGDNGFPRTVAGNSGVSRVVICDSRGNAATVAGQSAARGVSVSATGRAGISRSIAEITTMGGC